MPAATLDLDRLRTITAYLSSWLDWRVDHLGIPGAQVAIHLGRDLIHSGAHGTADLETGEALTEDHVFRVASHSKSFTAVTVLRLVEQGKVRLDDTVGEMLPDLSGCGIAGVSVRELLSHTGGVIRDGLDSDWWQLERSFPDRQELVRLVREEGRTYAPQEWFKYSNLGYGLLGLVVEEVTGRPFADHVREDVVDRLGLGRTAPLREQGHGPFVAAHSRPHGRERSRVVIDDVEAGGLASATGFCATARDLGRFFAAQVLGDGELLTDRSKRLMQRTEATVVRGGEQVAYGLGLMILEVGERRLVGHSGGYPGQITRTLVDPKDGLGVCVLTNSGDGAADPLAAGLVRLVDLLLGEPEGGRRELPDGVKVEDLDRLAGRYQSLWGVVDLVRGRDRLVKVSPTTPSPLDAADELHVDDAMTLRVVDQDSFGAAGEPIPVTLGEAGEVAAIRVAGVSHWSAEVYEARREGRWRSRA